MSLLHQLLDAITATTQPLTAVLERVMVSATEFESPLLRQWAQHELTGYPKGASLPSYRRSRPVDVRGDFIVYRQPDKVMRDETRRPERSTTSLGRRPRDPKRSVASPGITIRRYPPIDAQLKDVPIAPDRVPPPDRQRLFEHEFLKPVEVYEHWLSTKADIRVSWSPEALDRYRLELREGARCEAAWQLLSQEALLAVVGGVRYGLLEFRSDLKREARVEVAVDQPQIMQFFVNRFFAGDSVEQFINNQGTIGQVAKGRIVKQGDVSITQQGVDLNALLDVLRAAVEQLDGQLPAEQLDATRDLVKDLEEDAAGPQPAAERMRRKLKGIAAFARAAGPAGAAVIDAAQAIQRALGS